MKLPMFAGSFGVATCLLRICAVESSECTKGRLFIADADDAYLHVLDLDRVVDCIYEEVATLTMHKSGLGVMATETELATVMTRDRSDSATKGAINFYRPGITAVDQNGEKRVSKSAPSAVSFEITGWRPTHVSSSEGFIGIFMDGVAPTPGHSAGQPSSAVFVKESEVVADSGSLAAIEVPVEGMHHGVAYALAEDRFLITLTTEGDTLPDNFKVTNATGAVIETLGTEEEPLCPDYHGSAHVDHIWIFGCADAGLLHLTYDHESKTTATKLLPFPPPHDGENMTFRSSTVYGHESGRLYAADFSREDAYWNPEPPFYVIPLAHGASNISAENLVEINRSASEKTHCTFKLDRAKHDSGVVMLLVLHNDGNLQVVPLSSSGAPGTAAHVKITSDATLDCSTAQMVTGYGFAYIFIGGDQRELYTVDLKEVSEGNLDQAVTRMQLSFTPGRGGVALALPPSLACDNLNDNLDGNYKVCDANAAAEVAPALGLLLLSVVVPFFEAARQ